MSNKYLTPQGMITYFVVWRGDEDDFFITAHDMPETWDHSSMDSLKWVQLSYDAEYGFDCLPNPYVGDNPQSFELIQVFKSRDLEWVNTL